MSDKKPSDYFESNDEGIYVLPFTDKDKAEGRMGIGYPNYTILGIPGIALHPTWKLKKPTLVTTPKSPVLISKEESTSLTAQASHELESGVTYEYEWYTCNSDKTSPTRVSVNNTYTISKNTTVGTYHY